jgi:hypothetical protein
MKALFRVKPAGPRPDFRLVVSFLWSDMHNVDSDGDSYNPASRDWMELYLKNREVPSEVVSVHPLEMDPLILAVESESEALAARTAFFLARETDGEVADGEGKFGRYTTLESRVGAEFDHEAALRRADASVWRKATLENPYPNNLSGRGGSR